MSLVATVVGAVFCVDIGVNDYDYMLLAHEAGDALGPSARWTIFVSGEERSCEKCVFLDFDNVQNLSEMLWKHGNATRMVATLKRWSLLDDTLRSVSRAHAAKAISVFCSPYDVVLFLDADTKPCLPLENILKLLTFEETSLLDIYDVLVTPNAHPGFSSLGDLPRGLPIAFSEVNSGVVFYKKTTPSVHILLEDWFDGYVNSLHHPDNKKAHDQPSLRLALYAGVSRHNLRLYLLPAMWNMRAWRRYIVDPRVPAAQRRGGTNATRYNQDGPGRCCYNDSRGIDIIIDHKCGSRHKHSRQSLPET